MQDDWNSRSDMPDMIRDQAYRQTPALQEYEWTQDQRRERPIPIEIINSILAELKDVEDGGALPN